MELYVDDANGDNEMASNFNSYRSQVLTPTDKWLCQPESPMKLHIDLERLNFKGLLSTYDRDSESHFTDPEHVVSSLEAMLNATKFFWKTNSYTTSVVTFHKSHIILAKANCEVAISSSYSSKLFHPVGSEQLPRALAEPSDPQQAGRDSRPRSIWSTTGEAMIRCKVHKMILNH